MKDFELKPYMRLSILIDPDTLEYQVDMDGTLSILRGALVKVLEDLDNDNIIEKLTIEEN